MGRPEQIPLVPGDVEENGHAAVGLMPGRSRERDTVVEHSPPGCLEVVDAKEQTHPTCILVANDVALIRAVGLDKEKTGLRSGWFHDDPSLRASVVRRSRRVLNELEPQRADEESDGDVVVFYDQRGVLDVHAATVSPSPFAGLQTSDFRKTGPLRAVLRRLSYARSDLVRRVEGGEEIEITVAGRLAGRLVPAVPRRWQRWSEVADLFTGRPDAAWLADRDLITQLLQRSFDALSVDDDVAVRSGQLRGRSGGLGAQPRARVMDLPIAATALVHGARLSTRNASDLLGIEHLVEIVSI